MSQTRHACYADITNPTLKNAINSHCLSTVHLASLVSEFAREMAAAHEQFALAIQKIICTFRSKSEDLKSKRLVESPSTIFCAWENLLQETEMDGQAHLDAASLLIKNVCEPLHEVAQHKQSQAQKLQMFRDNFQDILNKSEDHFKKCEENYLESYSTYRNCDLLNNREGLRQDFHNAHNDYVLQIRASNRTIDEFQIAIPQVLEELDEIYIDTSNTINVAIESHSLLLLTKANEQQRRFENLLKICRQVNPQLDISYFAKVFSQEEARKEYVRHIFSPADHAITTEESVMNHLILDRVTEIVLRDRRSALAKEALELTSYIKQNQDITHTLVNICQRNLANHLYAKVYETQEDMCRKRNEIRIANLQLGAVRSQIELLTPKQNGSVDDDDKKNPSKIQGMWKKALKSLKNSASEPKLELEIVYVFGNMEENKAPSKRNEEKSKAQRKIAVTTRPFDASSLCCVTLEPPEEQLYGLKRSKSDCRRKSGIGSEEPVPERRPHTEKLRRKFKSTPDKPDLEELVSYASAEALPKLEPGLNLSARAKSDSKLSSKPEERITVALEVVKRVKIKDSKVHIYREYDFWKLIRPPRQICESDNLVDKNVGRRTKSEVLNPMALHLKIEERDRITKKTANTDIRFNSEAIIRGKIPDMCKELDEECPSLTDVFDSLLNSEDDTILRSGSFGVKLNSKREKESPWFSKPSFKQSLSSEDLLNEFDDDVFEQLVKIKEKIKQKRKRFQRSVSDKVNKNSKSDKAKKGENQRVNERLRRKSKSEELFEGINEDFLQMIQKNSGRGSHQDEESCSSSEDLLSYYPKVEKSQKIGIRMYSENSMDSIEEYVETPPGSPLLSTFGFMDKPKNEKKRKISAGKKIKDKISEICRKVSTSEQCPDKMKREKSFEKLKSKKHDIDKMFQKWLDHVIGIHVKKQTKKSSLTRKKQNSKEEEEVEPETSGVVDPVYSLLKCAADLPKGAGGGGGKSPCLVHPHCSGHHPSTYVRYPSGGDSSGSTSKTSSPSSSASHSPKTRRKKLNARMKSFSLDAPEPPKQLLGIDESTKKKSSSFTNTCFGVGGKDAPDEKALFSAQSLRKKFGLKKASSLEIEERKQRSHTPSPKSSPKSQKKQQVNLYVALYNFKAKEKDDIDLRAGSRVNVTDSSKKDWWKGKIRGKTGYFPATYVIPLQADQRVFQVLQPLNLLDGNNSIKFHKDQIVLQVGEEIDGMITIRAANNRQALCPLLYLQEL